MPRQLSSATSLDNLKKEAKRWMKALRAGDAEARERLRRAYPKAPADPALRDVQQALAVEYGCENWNALREKAEALEAGRGLSPRAGALQSLLRAADRGDVGDAAHALDAYPDIINERGELDGHIGLRTALHFGVHHEPIVRLLLERGADPNIRDQGDNAFPLHFVAETGELPIIKLLVEHGAQTTAGEVDDHELDIIGWATCFGLEQPKRDVVDYLVAHGATHTILSAVATSEVDIIRELVSRSSAVLNRRMDRTNHRRTPLHLAVVKKQPASLVALLDLGANTEAEDAAGLTALDQAALDVDPDLAQILIDRGARIRVPAAIALQRHDDIEPRLREDPDSLKPGGKWATLLIRASERGTAGVVETLIQYGADVNVRDDTQTSIDQTTGYTALHAAAFHGNVAAVAALLAAGADPTVRDSKYNSTPAGWADYGRKVECRDLILASNRIDIFDAIDFDLAARIPAILERDKEALNRPLGKYGDNDPRVAHVTPLAYATLNNKVDAVRVLREHGANFSLAGHVPASHPERVAEFLRMACLDWRVGGPERLAVTHAAGRLLARHPEIARANIYTAVTSGELEEVKRILAEHPTAAVEPGGPRAWPPLLYLCSTRLPEEGSWSAHAVEIARALLDHGADPNAYYQGGNETIHYTALTCVAGRGEEQASVHPLARPLAALLLDRGAEPYDEQFFYNGFGGHASHRHLADDDFVWLLDLIYEHSLRRGRQADWKDPDWKNIDMGGYGSGAWYLLLHALKGNRLALAEWCLAHGANPNPPRATDRRTPPGTLYEQAVRSGLTEFAELLVRYGTPRTEPATDPFEEFQTACMRLDRRRADALLSEHPEVLTNPAPLFTAAEHDLAPVAGLLLDLGMSPDMPNAAAGNTRALHMAAYSDSRRVATLLVERGATIDLRDDIHESTPIFWALWGGKPGMVDLLAPVSRDVWALAAAGKVDRLREVLAAEPHLAKGGGRDHALLFYLPNEERAAAEVARLLLAAGADPTVVRTNGVTPEQAARVRGLDAAADLMATKNHTHPTTEHDADLVREFLNVACWDHQTHGLGSYLSNQSAAMRMLKRNPELARATLETALVCGELEEAERILTEHPELATMKGGPRGWEPLLYLCYARLPLPTLNENALASARALLDRGADPNAYYMAGHARYSALVGVAGEGEQDAPRDHQHKEPLYQLLLERGAGPYDIQVLYNTHFSGGMLWWLQLTYAYDVARGDLSAWRDPRWSMLDMGGYGPGAHFILKVAIDKNDLSLAEWALVHGASPNDNTSSHPKFAPKHTLYEEAVFRGRIEMADLLVRYGAAKSQHRLEGEEAFVDACLRLDRDRARALMAEHPGYLQSPKAIFAAVELGRIEVVEWLLDQGVSIEIEDEHKQRPLHVAAGSGQLGIARMLIARGAGIDPRETQWHATPLGYAVYGNNREMIELLTPFTRSVWHLAWLGEVDRLEALLREEPHLAREVSPNDGTPLMWLPDDEDKAARIVALLLSHGADPRIRTKNDQMTAADYARQRRLDRAARMLEEAGAAPLDTLKKEA